MNLRRPSGLIAATFALSFLNVRCGSNGDRGADGDGDGSGGAGGAGTGGIVSGGGVTSSGGGSSSGGTTTNVGKGGATSSGGSTAAGNASGTGGKSGDGGANAAGASMTSTGGSSGTGGKSGGDGGTPNTGGASGGGNGGMGGAAGAPAGYTLVWSDEFNGAKGSGVDSSKWNSINKGDGFGNNELEFYTNRTDNAAMDGTGNLVITAKKETYMGRDYTSARLESNGKFEHTYGRIESRIKIPRGQGIWPAFWMLGNNIGSAGWPTCGEIDIMENIGKEPNTIHGSLHGPGYSGGNPLGAPYSLPNGAKFADDFHVFAIEWEKDVIRFYVDDHLYETKTSADVPAGKMWVYDHPFYVLLNVAVGGQWPGSPDGSTTFPQTMTVDYIRVYGK